MSASFIFVYFLALCLFIAVGLEVYKWYYTRGNSGYLFDNTITTFETQSYDQTSPHLMVPSRNEDMGQEFSYSFWLLIRNDVKKGDTTKRIVMSRGSVSPNQGNPIVFLGGDSETL